MVALDFEKNLENLKEKIEELKKISIEQNIDLSDEIKKLEIKLNDMEKEAYKNLSAWDKVKISRLLERPTALDYIKRIFDSFIELHGDRSYADDTSILCGIGSFKGIPVTIVAQQKGRDTNENIKRNFGMPHPEGYRKALRMMKQAEKFKRPIICFVDTPGAFPGIGAEERGQGEAIARNLMEMSSLKTPIISIVIGEGGSGGALALAVGDEIWMLEHSVYSILSPEGFASILFKDASKAAEAAEYMKITAQDLYNYGIIDKIIKEPIGGAHKNPDEMAKNIKISLQEAIKRLINEPIELVVEKRYEKFRKMGKVVE
ncbi:acetyl-coenzyme A carboxylase carboxyl transferase subunit alpha [Clostridium tepidiprofundi DSM 19306]|uniref:Acetyl-coenzyme A carboxylase carboxyl transferase subunit alpha n=1 Tax=Clostridium tepidiprofundi DSM 19306 TaxID=1121338 RepID=A0A151B4Q9_9CLOT|nr:acetyl-CoA carboxylase carboxyltransferase subunit alpha [Clostridium tepidiprofundi]KYH34876.1 acetyl-coenzyme A carboxylase carboxyl transferase subunit alpha [Clostridium tepidiprofundi DSM 19306]